MAAHQREKNK
jgi:hypothetical protein